MQQKSKILVYGVGAALFLAGGMVAQQRLVPTVSTIAPTFSFGMIGVGTGDSARLNVVNLVRTAPPIASAVFIPCKVELDLYDGQGKLINQKTVANLGFGEADSLDLVRSQVATSGPHVEITGVVKVGSAQAFFCNISPTLEVFDGVTGTTTAILTGTNAPLPVAVPLSAQ